MFDVYADPTVTYEDEIIDEDFDVILKPNLNHDASTTTFESFIKALAKLKSVFSHVMRCYQQKTGGGKTVL